MSLRELVEQKYSEHVEKFEQSDIFRCFEFGELTQESYDKFIINLCQTHLKSSQVLAFLYAVSPPRVALRIQHNMLEELGMDEQGVSHPMLLHKLAASLEVDVLQLEISAQEELWRMCSKPLVYETLKELGLAVLLEVTCFEWMLSRLANRFSKALAEHKELSSGALEWFSHHAEVDVRHAEEGLDSVVDYVDYYGFNNEYLNSIIDITFRENIFIKRYFSTNILATNLTRISYES